MMSLSFRSDSFGAATAFGVAAPCASTAAAIAELTGFHAAESGAHPLSSSRPIGH